MNMIDGVSLYNKIRTADVPVVPPSNYVTKESNKQSRRDSFLISDDFPQDTNWNAAVDKELETLTKSFPNINIFIQKADSSTSVTYLAEILGYGSHLVISEDWLAQMSTGAEGFENGKQLLKKLLLQLSSNMGKFPATGVYLEKKGVTIWTGSEQSEANKYPNPYENYKAMLEQLKDSLQKKDTSFKSKMKTKFSNYTVAGLYSRLAGSSSKQHVRATISEVHRSIGSLQLVSALGDSDERSKARTSIASLRKLLLRGNRKIQRLSAEEIVQLREKRARKRAEEDRALALRIELRKQQTKRKSADAGVAREGQLEDMHNAYRHSTRKQEDSYYGKYADHIPSSLALSSIQTAPISDISSSTDGSTVLKIQISPMISFTE